MESTTTNYTTNKTLMDYYKSNIDVHINWLLFMNAFRSLSNNKSFMEIAPILESIRKEAYNAFEYELIPDDTREVNKQVVKVIAKLLEAHDVEDVKDKIGIDLKEEDVINLSTALFMRNSLQEQKASNIPDISTSDELKFIIFNLSRIKYEKIATSIDVKGYSANLINYYLESLKIQYDTHSIIQNYIYTVLQQIRGIDLFAKKLFNEKTNTRGTDIDFVLKELFDNMYIISNYSLANIIDDLNENLEKINGLTPTEIMSLKKHI